MAIYSLAQRTTVTTIAAASHAFLSPATNEYAIRYGSGAWFRYPIDELLMSPWTEPKL